MTMQTWTYTEKNEDGEYETEVSTYIDTVGGDNISLQDIIDRLAAAALEIPSNNYTESYGEITVYWKRLPTDDERNEATSRDSRSKEEILRRDAAELASIKERSPELFDVS